MEPLLFTFKRLALLAGPMTRAFAGIVNLTPQRVDMMFFLRDRPMIQRDLAFEMGVVRSVVSKMVTSMEKLGLVERRGVEGDRRLRLVTLTKHAFDLMSDMLEVAALGEYGNTLQIACERQVIADFEDDLRAQKVGISDFSVRDHRELMARMRTHCFSKDSKWRAPPWDELPTERENAEVHAYWRQMPGPRDDTWIETHVDGAVAKAHVGAGISLDYSQRFPKRKRGRRPRVAAAA
jgi:DNA-binding MarR family transcriptional regulator